MRHNNAITICSPQLGLSPKSVLGGEVFDREVLLGLAKKGIKIDILLPKGVPVGPKVKNWHITRLPVKRVLAITFNILVIPYLFLTYQRVRFKVLRLHAPPFLAFGVLFFKIFHPDVKLIAVFHQFKETEAYGFGRFINRNWNYIITDSENVRQKIITKYHVDPIKISAIHNGAPKYLYPQTKNKDLIEKYNIQGKIVLFFMGFFIHRKNPLLLLDILLELGQIKEKVVLIYWGQGPLKEEIIKKAKILGIFENIRFINPIYGEEKNDIHNLADIFLHPANDEGFALAPLEAMSCAKPVIMNRAHSANEIIDDNINGFICGKNDSKDWSIKIRQLIKNKKLRLNMGQMARKKVEKEYNWKFSVEKHLEILKKIDDAN